ncbi:MAG: FAD-dependent oxidoreductase [Clostridia bacterium]|nr:FAD-dependent oxidoreductase [Clostridia bacterium]
MCNSIWTEQIKYNEFPELIGEEKTDVLIVGGGLCGILCAYFLSWAGVDYKLVEAGKIGSGISGKTTAKISVLQGLSYSKLIPSFGREKAQLYLNANKEALERYTQMAKNFDCDFVFKPAYIYSLRSASSLEKEVRAIRSLGGMAEYVEKTTLPFQVVGAVKMPKQAQFHPIKFINKISENLNIYEHSRVTRISGNTAYTEKGSVKANKIIIATHFPFINIYGGYSLKLYQNRSYMMALDNITDIDGMYVDEDLDGMTFRNQGSTLIIGAGGSRTGTYNFGPEKLEHFLEKYYPETKKSYVWAAQDCMSLDGLPYIGRYSGIKPNMYVATGFNKWGITSSMIAALLLRDIIMERENEYAELFSPQRSIMHRQLLCNGVEAVKNMISLSTKRCSHLGCALKWNRYEHSWDCPCHGSRFDGSGNVIDNPANKSNRHL